MSMIRVQNLTFSYPSSHDNIFENVNFQIDIDWKLGFIGRNGRRKITFLNLLLGRYEYHGKIQSSVQFDYFPYPVNDKSRLTADILAEVCPLAEEWELFYAVGEAPRSSLSLNCGVGQLNPYVYLAIHKAGFQSMGRYDKINIRR